VSARSRRSTLAVFACLLASGAVALVYEVVWARLLGLVMGHTAYALSAILTSFLGGLADRLGRLVVAEFALLVYGASPIAMVLLLALFGGASAVVWGYCVSTVLLWHATYSINSLAHRWGTRRYATPDESRNNWLLGLLTLGEGWHNNHHHYCAAARQGFLWWEIDVTYYLLRALAAIGVVWEIREPPRHVVKPDPGGSLDRAA